MICGKQIFRVTWFSAVSVFLVALPAFAQNSTPLPSDENKLVGDHVRLLTNIGGFKPFPTGSGEFCAPAGSRLAVSDEDGTTLYVRFLSITNEDDTFLGASFKEALKQCPPAMRVNDFTAYKLARTSLQHLDYRRSGISFGGLVVPFKFRLGSSKELVSSASIAPYVGFRTASFAFGLSFTPVLAAGLSLVPVADPSTNSTSSKSAYTLAIGFRLASSKNENFNAGFLIGKDYLSAADRALDPSVTEKWISIYLGYSM